MKLITMLFTLIAIQSLFAQTNSPNPGNTGTNAFEFIKYVDDPVIGNNIRVDFQLSSASNLIGRANTMIFRVEVPFLNLISIGGDYRIEKFKNNPAAIEQYQIPEAEGTTEGDFNIYTKIRVLEEKYNLPAVSLKATIKTAAGDFTQTRRYTDSAGYEISVTAGKSFFKNEKKLLQELRTLLEIGFVAWDTQLGQQNDAYKISAGSILKFRRSTLEFDMLFHQGWIDKDLDTYLSLRSEFVYHIKRNISANIELRKGLTDAAPKYYGGVGLKVRIAK